MKSPLNRRRFLRQSALLASTLPIAGRFASPSLLAANTPSRLRCVQIGCGGRGMSHLDAILQANKQELVAIVDVFEPRHAAVQKWLQDKGHDASRIQVFTDYRRMFDRLAPDFDAVFIAMGAKGSTVIRVEGEDK